MIFVIDDDEAIRLQSSEALAGAGFEVRDFARASEALSRAAEREPELILCDVLMPEMNGIAFREAYAQRFPERRTPFLFLSSLDDPTDVVRGLEVGADDYLVKPVLGAVLVARIKAHLRRARRAGAAVFTGDLAKFPFAKVLQFCDLHGFSGEIEVSAPGVAIRLQMKAGSPTGEALEAPDDPLGRCLELSAGQFTLVAAPIDFSELRGAAIDAAARRPEPPPRKPAGRLSGVRAGSRLFQIQSEYAVSPACQAVTVVMLDGKTVLKRASPPAQTFELAAAEKLIAEQHLAVEREVREKLESLSSRSQPPSAPSPKAQFERLFEEGLARFLDKDYAAAVKLFEQAQAAAPTNKLVAVHLTVARKKLGAAA